MFENWESDERQTDKERDIDRETDKKKKRERNTEERNKTVQIIKIFWWKKWLINS